jgi:hypothetical protein
MNQCDGCQIRARNNAFGQHVMPNGGRLICTKERYPEPSDAERPKVHNEVDRLWAILLLIGGHVGDMDPTNATQVESVQKMVNELVKELQS